MGSADYAEIDGARAETLKNRCNICSEISSSIQNAILQNLMEMML
jgi:hypothetical protein